MVLNMVCGDQNERIQSTLKKKKKAIQLNPGSFIITAKLL